MVWPLREWRLVTFCLLLSCFLLLGFAAARGKPDIYVYVVEGSDASELHSLIATPRTGVPSQVTLTDTSMGPVGAARYAGSSLESDMETDAGDIDATSVGSADQSTASGDGVELGASDESNATERDEQSAAAEMIAESDDFGALPMYIPDLLAVINEYDVQDWQTVKGIGPALANRIVECRQLKGKFESLDDLLEVSGIGPAKLSQIEAHLQAEWGW